MSFVTGTREDFITQRRFDMHVLRACRVSLIALSSHNSCQKKKTAILCMCVSGCSSMIANARGLKSQQSVVFDLAAVLSFPHHLKNAFHAAGEYCRRQVPNFTKSFKNVNILEFGDYIWKHQEKCIQISTNMPCIGSLIREIHVKISAF